MYSRILYVAIISQDLNRRCRFKTSNAWDLLLSVKTFASKDPTVQRFYMAVDPLCNFWTSPLAVVCRYSSSPNRPLSQKSLYAIDGNMLQHIVMTEVFKELRIVPDQLSIDRVKPTSATLWSLLSSRHPNRRGQRTRCLRLAVTDSSVDPAGSPHGHRICFFGIVFEPYESSR